ncbi:MAG TPA: hypothetical protein VGL15_01100, partial [Vicinamibacteria bacterium]
MESARDPRFRGAAGRYALLAALFVLAGGYQVRALADVVRILRGERVRQPVVLDSLDGRVISARPEAEAAGIRRGDRVVAVQGAPFYGRKTLAGALAAARPEERLSLTVERPGEGQRGVVVRLVPLIEGMARREDRIITVATMLALPVMSLGLGFTVAALRPRDGRAWLLLLMMASFAQLPGGEGLDEASWEPGLRDAGLFYDALLVRTWSIWMMLFGIYFPDRHAFDCRRPWVKWLLIVPIGFFAIAEAVAEVAAAEGLGAGASVIALTRAAGPRPFFLTIPAVGIFFAALGTKAGMASTPDARRRVSLVYWGATFGLTPTFVWIMAGLVTRRPDVVSASWILVVIFGSLVVFP